MSISCPKCQRELNEGDRQCPACGCKLFSFAGRDYDERRPPHGHVHCADCKRPRAPGHIRCPHCGGYVIEDAQAPARKPVPAERLSRRVEMVIVGIASAVLLAGMIFFWADTGIKHPEPEPTPPALAALPSPRSAVAKPAAADSSDYATPVDEPTAYQRYERDALRAFMAETDQSAVENAPSSDPRVKAALRRYLDRLMLLQVKRERTSLRLYGKSFDTLSPSEAAHAENAIEPAG